MPARLSLLGSRRRRPALLLLAALLGLVGLSAARPAAAQTTYVVATTDDTTGAASLSLRDAINSANNDGGGDTITFDPAVFTPGTLHVITLGSALTLSVSMTITGPGASVVAVDGAKTCQPFYVNSGVTATLSGLTVQNGNGNFGGGVFNAGTLTLTGCTLTGNTAQYGGGVFNTGTLTLTGCTLTANTATANGGGIYSYQGTLTLTGCTLTGNTAQYGGDVFNTGTLTLTGCTLTNNTATNSGGGVYNSGTLTLTGCTLTGNTAQYGGGLYNDSGSTSTLTGCTLTGNNSKNGGGVLNNGTLTLTDDILYGDSAPTGGEVYVASGSATATYSDIGQASGGTKGYTGDTTDINADPKFVSGTAPYDLHLQSTSPSSCLSGGTPATDANGKPITDHDGNPYNPSTPSMGAFQYGFYTVTTLSDSGVGSLRAAIAYANANGSANGGAGTVINFLPALSGTIPLASALPALSANMTITGPGASVVAVDGAQTYRPFAVNSGVTASLSGLTIQNGNVSDGSGGGVYNSGTLTLTGCTLTGNSATKKTNLTSSGGGVYNDQNGTLTLTGCTLTNNSASNGGGGIESFGTLTLTGCTLTGNQAVSGGGVLSSGTLTLAGCTLTGNVAQYYGGGVANGTSNGVPGTLTLTDDILYGDSASQGGNEIYVGGGSVTPTSCDIQGGDGNGGDPYPGTGNIDADPLLSALGNYGGPTQTLALLPGSPCLGAGTNAGLSADQRGVAIPQNGRYDIGAFESQGFTLSSVGGTPQSTTVNTAFPNSLTVTVTANDPNGLEPVAGGVLVVAAPATTGPSATISAFTVASDGSGLASATATADSLVGGPYTVTASTNADSGPASYSLTNTPAIHVSPQFVSPSGLDSNDGSQGSPKLTIQAAINATKSGDMVIIEDGTYAGPGNVNLDFGGRNDLTVTSMNGPATTIIDGGGTDRGFILQNGETGALINGLTIRDASGYAGGGVYNSNAALTLTNCTLAGNNAGGNSGGGIFNDQYGTLTLTDCTLTGNSGAYGGGINNAGPLTLTGCTLTGNSADQGGGGIATGLAVTVTLTGCTLDGNSASYGGGFYVTGGTLTLADDILYNDSGYDEIYNQGGAVTATSCDIQGGDGNGNDPYPGSGNIDADPLLSALGSYGGPTQTLALLPGSPCLGAGTKAGLKTDQRGVAVPQSGRYDIGAFESQGFVVTTASGSTPQSTPITQGFPNSLSATVAPNAAGEPVAGGLLLFTAPASGASATLSAASATLTDNGDGTGTGSVTATANGTVGGYNVPATTNAGSATFGLTNTQATPALTIALTSGSNPSNVGDPLTFTATLTGAAGPSAPDTITFSVDGGAAVAADANSTTFTATGGTATFTTSTLAAGTHTISAKYSGDTNNASASTGTLALTQTVKTHVNPQYVSPTGSDSNDGSQGSPKLTIQAAINATNSGDTVIIEDGTYTGPGDVDLSFGGKNVTVTSLNGAAKTIINCAGSSSAPHRGFFLNGGETNAVISGLTIENGYSPADQGGQSVGGGIFNNSVLTLAGCTFANDSASVGGGFGGGVYNGRTLTVTGCTFTGGAANNSGGGIDSDGGITGVSVTDCTITDCTFASNTARFGGAVLVYTGTVTATGCTFTGNTSTAGYGAFLNNGSATLTDDIFYGDNGGEVVPYGGTTSETYCDDGGLNNAAPDANGNIGANPLLTTALGNYGGPTQTFALLPGSPCLGAGTNAGLSADQRGVAIPQNGRYDVGAFESQGFTLSSVSGTPQSTPVTQKFATLLSVTVTARDPAHLEPVGGGILVVTAPATSGASASLTPFTVGTGGAVSATATADSLAGGPYTVTATTRAETGSPVSYALTNLKAVPTVTVTSNSPNSTSTYGDSVTFTATLAGAVNPTGSVTFSVDGGAAIPANAFTLSATGGTATFTTKTLAAGTHVIKATYGGDANNAAATSAGFTQVVSKTQPTVSVTSDSPGSTASAGTSTIGATVTFTATLRGAVNPTGSVTFLINGNPQTQTALTSTTNGSTTTYTATFATSTLPIGPNYVSAEYDGDPSNDVSHVSPVFVQTVTKATPTVTVASSQNPSVAGQSVTFTATLTNGDSPTGTVTFTLDGGTPVTATDFSGTTATFTPPTLSVGTHAVTVNYGGDGNNAPESGSLSPVQTVNKAAPTTGLTSSPNPSTFGQSVTFTATLTGGDSPTGSVTFTIDGTAGTPVALSSGVAAFQASTLAPGSHSVTAQYSGDANNAPGTAGAVTQVVNQASSTTALASSLNPSKFGQSVTFTATVTGQSPTGTVTFTDTTTGATLGVPALSSGKATVSTSTLSVGSHVITAAYGGDTNNAGSDNTASPLTQVVNKATSATGLTSSLNPSQFGQSVTFTATVTGQSPTGTVTFTIDATPGTPATLTNGSASSPATTTLSVGPHTITAAYSGDGNNAASSQTLTQTVGKAGVGTTLTSSLNPSFVGQSVTFTAIVTGHSPTGTVTFSDGATALGGPVSLSSGSASLTTSALAVGSRTITAKYSGDGNNAASSATLTQTVTNTTVTVASVSGPYGQPIPLSATLRGRTGSLLSGKTLAFSVDGAAVGSAATNASGVATLSYTVPGAYSPNPHTITVTFAGDGVNAASTGTGTLTVTQAGTSLTVPGVAGGYGQTIPLNARLTRMPDHAPVSGGTLSFFVDGVSAGSAVTDVTGTASQNYVVPNGLAPGGHNVTVSFAGMSGYGSTSGGPGTLTVNKAGVSLVVPSSSGARGTTGALTATLRRSTDGTPLSGRTVTFTVGGKAAGTAVTNGSGVASRPYAVPSGSATGSQTVVASYVGDGATLAGTGSGTLTVR